MLNLLDWVPVDGHTYAAMRGGRQWLGWTPAAQVAADTWDLNALVAVSGGKKSPRPPTYPRPSAAPATPKARAPVMPLAQMPGAIDVRQYVTA